MHLLRSRYAVLFSFLLFFVGSSFLVRTVLLLLSLSKTSFSLFAIVTIYGYGLVYDIGVAIFFVVAYSCYLLILPNKLNNSWFNRYITYFFTFLVILISMFSFFAEFTFWQEFESRFNFIAVDYLIYTYEVINNINQSYPMPLLVSAMLLLAFTVFFVMYKSKVFVRSFNADTAFRKRVTITGAVLALTLLFSFFVSNNWTDKSNNHYQNELAKAGVFSFFSAYKNNELNYEQFYSMIKPDMAFSIIRNTLQEPQVIFTSQDKSIKRTVSDSGTFVKPNIIMVTIESFSADFMEHFGNKDHLTPTLDSLANKGLFFTNMYATGTRTVRGMEALSLAVPPTPGNSIVRRPDNANLMTVGNVFKRAGYDRSFIYGGDGYFDNMNQYFSSNGFNLFDRGKALLRNQNYPTEHEIIPDSMVSFENAWGIADEDLYEAVIANADAKYAKGKMFYNFVMTTSNHRPFTYPDGKIDIPSHMGRAGAVKYTDYAIGQFLKKIQHKPWFKNTVIIFVADHCASSAGKNEIDIAKYHIPCIITNMPNMPATKIDKMCSQIDLYPTLFKLMGWTYESSFFGKNVLSNDYQPRIVLGTYQKLAYLKNDSLVILNPLQKVETYLYNKSLNEQLPANLSESTIQEAIAYYQTAYFLFKNGGLAQ